MTRPTVGRIVHYVAHGSKDGTYPVTHRAAIVAEADQHGRAILCVLNPRGIFFTDMLPEDPTGTESGTWHWPERD